MIRALLLLVVLAAPACAQDVVGIEDCSKTQGVDRKAGCLQSNVNYLHELIRKNEAAAQTRAREPAAQLAAANARIEALRTELAQLKAAVEELRKAQAAARPK
jgi:uncharacterized protein YceH (UPF0502 family)